MDNALYEIGQLCNDLAEEKGVTLKSIDMEELAGRPVKDLENTPYDNELIFAMHSASQSIGLMGKGEGYSIMYMGTDPKTSGTKISEGLEIKTEEVTVTVLRSNRHGPYNKFKVTKNAESEDRNDDLGDFGFYDLDDKAFLERVLNELRDHI